MDQVLKVNVRRIRRLDGDSWLSKTTTQSTPLAGPVTTDPESYYYLDAVVGSNNTGELSALMEAALFILGQQNIPLEVEFVYASQWAANVITGKFRPKRNRAMVYTAKRIFESLSCKTQVKWRWTKGHAGNAYNERADELAEVGNLQVCMKAEGLSSNLRLLRTLFLVTSFSP